MSCRAQTYRRAGRAALLGMLTWLGLLYPSSAQDIDYQSQSLFIYKFAKYISWPESSVQGDFVIGVYGNSPVLGELEKMASLKKAGGGQRIVVRQVNSTEEIGRVHLLYVAASKSRELKDIAARVNSKPTLVVAEREGLARKGACINFIILENNTLRFEINRNELKNHGLRIPPELLKIGFAVG